MGSGLGAITGLMVSLILGGGGFRLGEWTGEFVNMLDHWDLHISRLSIEKRMKVLGSFRTKSSESKGIL